MPTSRLCVIAEASSFFAAMFNITARSIGEKLSTEVNAFGLNSIIWLEVFHRFRRRGIFNATISEIYK